MKYRHRRDKGIVEVVQEQDNSWKVSDAKGLIRMTDADFHKYYEADLHNYYEPVTPFDPPETKEPTIQDLMNRLGEMLEVIELSMEVATAREEAHDLQRANDMTETDAWRVETRKRIMDLSGMLQLHHEESGPC